MLERKVKKLRDARIHLIVAEGDREDEYFNAIKNFSNPRVEVVVEDAFRNTDGTNSGGNSSPKFMPVRAEAAIADLKSFTPGSDYVWYICDIDRHRKTLTNLISEEEAKPNRFVLISNPCFEVWLWHHYITESNETELASITDWKSHLHTTVRGGYKLEVAIQNLELAINNAKNRYKSNGHFPEVGCSSVYMALEKILPKPL